MILGALFRQEGIGVNLSKSLVSAIRLQHRFCLDMDTGILEQLEAASLVCAAFSFRNSTAFAFLGTLNRPLAKISDSDKIGT